MTQARELYLSAADSAAKLLAAPEVADAWFQPSALAKLSVQGLAGHLAGQVFLVPTVLAEREPTEPAISIHAYYARVSWIGSDLDTPFNQAIRSGGEEDAAEGPAALATRVAASVEALRAGLPGVPNRRVRRPTWGPWSISFDDFVTSRLLELVVHSDDLAYSVGVPTPEFPAAAVETVVDLLTRIALRRHGATDVLRALSRSERAPASISAL
ncbi:maleylpyruvate isomerase N-terminal domain-containing protein [Streptacidiphilus fuscans]|uniref:Maleylpyruvate isomerase N-terminal domain-containing protein n=1 Tax=Streptacidiphilus fuscans TaxID=2789292 RepID=A0A931AZ51_9ACTN|nr:maleylpyruvate isomerase N-terminal domain-containing protein [Streptacidiphilus fuscans]MBF9067228.1 maleylpyruvate isomerase N-terminal domain-containing protein [Streptacidiphilus fuscans]